MARPRKQVDAAQGDLSPMSALALRIWEGQSPDLPLIERVKRIKAGVSAQGYEDIASLELPDPGFRKYL